MKSISKIEERHLEEDRKGIAAWKKWGPYLSERQWGTVREDYSKAGDAWNYFSHDHARSRSYRWGEDGLAGISDDKQRLCFALALWNGKDAILKERLFGLTNSEGNHGEDVKEYYFYLDSTPTHSYMKYLYKYPQNAFPYSDLVETNRRRTKSEQEYELIDTGVFDDDRYFDVFVEYAKTNPDEILIRITAFNRGKSKAALHILPTLWFRNGWAAPVVNSVKKPIITQVQKQPGVSVAMARHQSLGNYIFSCYGNVPLLFTNNETNKKKLNLEGRNSSKHLKDGINDFIVSGTVDAINSNQRGTKMSAHYYYDIDAGQSVTVKLCLVGTGNPFATDESFFDSEFDRCITNRQKEAGQYYQSVIPKSASVDEANIMRQSLAGMLWSKQYYFFDAQKWLNEHNANPLRPGNCQFRNREWYHMLNEDIISMPDKWEYPWYASWDLAFQTLPLSIVDTDFAKKQMKTILRGSYLHPSGQLPAYEWNFSAVDPPVHAWAILFLHRTEQARGTQIDWDFLKLTFNKLLLNFTWWVNRKDRFGKNIFEGGCLGLDNIGVFDRGAPLPTGGYLEQADGTSWIALFCQNMLELAIELTSIDRVYEDMVLKFIEHFLFIAAAINMPNKASLWDEEDGFYYDMLQLPDGSFKHLKVRSMVGLLPLCAVTLIEKWQRQRIPGAMDIIQDRQLRMPELFENIHPLDLGVDERQIISIVNPERLRRILTKMLDENEFLSPYGIRSLSKFHLQNPYVINVDEHEYRVGYLPGESDIGMFGGNSNWRGPVWFPMNILIYRALLYFYSYYGDSFMIECPTGSGTLMNLFEVSKEISKRLIRIFTRDKDGRRPVYGTSEKFQIDPYWKDNILFYEYFHADNGTGLGASHQTGWTGLIATLMELNGKLDADTLLRSGRQAIFVKNKS